MNPKLFIPAVVLFAIICICSCKKKDVPTIKPITAAGVKAEILTVINSKDSLTTFAGLLNSAELTDTEVAIGITLFAPVNQAFNNKTTAIVNGGSGILMSATSSLGIMATNTILPDNSDVRDYIIKGKINPEELTNGKSFTALSGKQLNITVKDGVLYINNVPISGKNIASGNDYHLFTISAFINDSKQLKIGNFSDENSFPGWLLTIYGSNFSALPSDNVVKIDGKQALVHASSPDSLLVTVPLGANTGNVTVTVKDKTVTSAKLLNIMQLEVNTINPWIALQCQSIQGITVDKNDNIYFTDPVNSRVFGFNPYNNGGANFKYYAPLVQSQIDVNQDGIINANDKVFAFSNCWAIAADKQGQVYVNSSPNTVTNNGGSIYQMKMNTLGELTQLQLWAGGNTKGAIMEGSKESLSLISPTAMTFDNNGGLLFNQFVSNSSMFLERINGAGICSSIITQIQLKSVSPDIQKYISTYGIVTDSIGNIYFTDVNNTRIWKFSSKGLSIIAGNPNNTPKDGVGIEAQFGAPFGITIDKKGNLYVCDNIYATNTYLVRMINPQGVVTTIAGGKNDNNTAKDGNGADARFNGVNTICIDSKGVLYVGSDDGTIRRIIIK